MDIRWQIKLVDELISANQEATVKDFIAALREIDRDVDAIERATVIQLVPPFKIAK